MASEGPRKPENVRTKYSVSVSVRTIGKGPEDEETEIQDGKRVVKSQPTKSSLEKRTGTHELLPKPTNDPNDPLSWPKWKKELAFSSILLSFATAAVLKTIFVPTNAVIATQFDVSYVAATALTGIPFIVGAFSGLGSSILSGLFGKRMLYVLSGVLALVSGMWTMHIERSYDWFMVSRCFQGIAWGIVDTLVCASIRDMYFEHERQLRIDIMNVTSLVFTWGSPILGGYLSQSREGFHEAYMVLTIIQGFSVPLLMFLAPETTFDRTRALPAAPNQISWFKSFLVSLNPISYQARFSVSEALLPIRALFAPTAILTFLTTFPLVATSFALAHSLSLLFSSMPTFLFPSRLGYLLIFPATISLGVFVFMVILSRFHLVARYSLAAVAPGIIIGSSGLLAFGLYTVGELSPDMLQTGGMAFSLDIRGDSLSLKVVSALLGMLVAGGVSLLSFSSSSLASSSTTNIPSNSLPLETAHRVHLEIFTGIFITCMPKWIQMSMDGPGVNVNTQMMMMGLKDASVGLSFVQLSVGSLAAVIMWTNRKNIVNFDKRILGLAWSSSGKREVDSWKTDSSHSEV